MSPTLANQPTASRARTSTPTIPAPTPCILVVEDNAEMRQCLVRTLAAAGWKTVEAEHGRMALVQLARHHIDLLLTDLVMPEAEGIELIIEVHRTRPALPILAISGEGTIEPGEFLPTARLVGAHRTLAKPFRPEDLRQIVRELLQHAA